MRPRAIGKRRPYQRSMAGWWRRNTFFVEYMIHEGTAIFVGAYALVLLVGLVRLGQGEAAWASWLTALKSPVSVGFHILALAAMLYHSWTWFNIMPRTLPPILIDGKRLSARAMTAGGLVATVFASIAMCWLVWKLAP